MRALAKTQKMRVVSLLVFLQPERLSSFFFYVVLPITKRSKKNSIFFNFRVSVQKVLLASFLNVSSSKRRPSLSGFSFVRRKKRREDIMRETVKYRAEFRFRIGESRNLIKQSIFTL